MLVCKLNNMYLHMFIWCPWYCCHKKLSHLLTVSLSSSIIFMPGPDSVHIFSIYSLMPLIKFILNARFYFFVCLINLSKNFHVRKQLLSKMGGMLPPHLNGCNCFAIDIYRFNRASSIHLNGIIIIFSTVLRMFRLFVDKNHLKSY